MAGVKLTQKAARATAETVKWANGQGRSTYGQPAFGQPDNLPTIFLCRITAVSGSFPTFTYTVQKVVSFNNSNSNAAKWVTDSINLSAKNGAEFSGTATYTYGNGVSITNASTGAINSQTCVIKALGVGCLVWVTAIKNVAGGYQYVFCEPNSGQ